MATERLQKILARGGFSSRRAAERLITEGKVRVNGRIVTELGSKADPYKDKVEVNGVRVVAEQAVYVLIHKPRGVVTTMSDPEGRPSIREILAPVGSRVYPVGRLDFATSGVLLATNDGDFAEGLMHPKKAVPKMYVVKVHGAMENADFDRWRNGVRLEDGMTAPAKLSFLRYEGDKTWFELTIREGRNQQIRRMGEATGFPVMRLARLSFAGVTAEGLRPGAWRYLTPDELTTLKQEYGVPRRIVDAEMRPTGRTRPRKAALKTPGRVVRTAASARRRDEASPAAAETTAARGPGRRGGRGSSAPAAETTGARGPGRRGGRGSSAPAAETTGARGPGRRGRGSPPPAAEASGASAGQPRYGGGAPGRRGYDVKDDWGGGAGRGRTGRERGDAEQHEQQHAASGRRGATSGGRKDDGPPRGDVGGRSGQSRTTGSGGGIGGASGGDYRMKGRSGRSR
jgi:23S rRNA pseudouridine2605 synthase